MWEKPSIMAASPKIADRVWKELTHQQRCLALPRAERDSRSGIKPDSSGRPDRAFETVKVARRLHRTAGATIVGRSAPGSFNEKMLPQPQLAQIPQQNIRPFCDQLFDRR